jgi:hypothetical protein
MTDRKLCDQIAADAAGLMAMPADAPERRRAEEHARTHADCARALAEARQLLALIEGNPLPGPSPAAMERASEPILHELQGAGSLAILVGAMVVAAWAAPLAMMRAHIAMGPDLVASIALAALAALVSALVVTRAGYAGLSLIALSALTIFVPGGDGHGLEARLGLHCALTEVAAAAFVGTVAFFGARSQGRRFGDKRILLPALGGGALAGHAALEVGCRAAHSTSHLLVFHTGPVALAVMLALILAGAASRRTLEARS